MKNAYRAKFLNMPTTIHVFFGGFIDFCVFSGD